jgi:signal transduction histidine kinase
LILRTAALYVAIFVCVLLALDAGAYVFMLREYTSLLGPALATPEGSRALAAAMRPVAAAIATIDVPLIVIVAFASYALARTTIAPLAAARERERIFAADSAHALRSPLATIAAVAQAARPTANADTSEALETIVASTLDASRIVGDLLTLARRPQRDVLQCEPVDLAAIVSVSVGDVEPIAAAHGIRIESSPESAIVDGDERRLKELARNLLENAVHHAHGTVRVASRRNGRIAEIVVEDDGGGVPPEERERIFERFYRHSNNGSGSGLGLAIVDWIARAHQGTIAVGDAPAGGARFVASLPVRLD